MYVQDYSTSETLDKVVSLLEYTIRNPLEIFEVSDVTDRTPTVTISYYPQSQTKGATRGAGGC